MNKSKKYFAVFFMILVLGIFLSGCDIFDDSDDSEEDVIITDQTKILDDETMQQMTYASTDGDTLIFPSDASEISDLESGEIIVSGLGNGLLRQVVSVQTSGNEIVVFTRAAKLTDVFEKGSLEVSQQIRKDDLAQFTPLKEGVHLVDSPNDLFDFQIDNVQLYDHVVANGNLTISDPRFELEYDIAFFQLEQLKFTGTITETANIEIEAGFNFPDIDQKIEIARLKTLPITIMVGAVPVVVTPVISVYVGINGEAQLSVTVGANQNAEFTAGLEYDGDWSPIGDYSNSFTYNPPDINANCNLKAYIQPKIELLLYDVVSTALETNAYQQFEADIEDNPWWTLYGGLDAKASVSTDMFDISYNVTVFEYQTEITNAGEPFSLEPPVLLSPIDDATNVSNPPNFQWHSSPASDDYTLQVSTASSFSDFVVNESDITDTTYTSSELENNTVYYWRVRAENETDVSDWSEVWNFEIMGTPGIQVNSEPSGASIYLDGTNMNQTTPAFLEDVASGNHHVRLYKEGYNEYNENFTLEEGETYVINADLGEPTPPLPIFTIYEPSDGETFSDNVITVSGLIQLEDNSGNISDFNGEQAILTLNGTDREISVEDGEFSETVSIVGGENTIQLRATSENGDTGVSDLITVYGEFGTADIEITLTWNTPTSDLDLHVWNPDGEHCYYQNMSISDGSLDIDDVEGYGPETFTSEAATDGTYIVKINCYSLDQDNYADATVTVELFGEDSNTYGPHHFTVADGNGNDPAAWWEVTTFSIGPARFVNLNPAPRWLIEKVQKDMKNLPSKDK